MMTIREYKRAESLEEAWQLNQKRPNRVLGGMIWLKMENINVGTAIDLSGLGLDTIEETDEGFSIGAMVTLRQIELHPGCNQEVTREFCNRHDIVVEAWSPLGSGRVLENQLLIDIAASYGCTVAQLCLRWCLQRRAIPLPKSTDPARIAENARIFWFDITDEDLQRIDELDPLGQSGLDPDTIDF